MRARFRWDTVTLATALKSVGYDTALIGKWHLGSKPEWSPQKFGFDHSYGSLAGGVGPWDHRYKHGRVYADVASRRPAASRRKGTSPI